MLDFFCSEFLRVTLVSGWSGILLKSGGWKVWEQER